MGQLAQDIHDEAADRVPAAPVTDPADLLSGPDLLAIFAKVEAAIAVLELLSRGARILRTAGAPDNTTDGEDGDLAINLATTQLYAKDGGTWVDLFKLKGDKGDNVKGDTGASAYQLAVQQGFTGSLDQWLASLGRAGNDGLSAYQVAKQQGFAGTVTQWLESLEVQGEPGQRGNIIRWESYAPTNEAGQVGDCWIYSMSASKVAMYKCTSTSQDGTTSNWSLRFTSPEPVASGGNGSGYTLPQATSAVLGGVKSSGNGLTGNVVVNSDGSMTAPGGGASSFAQLDGAPTDNAALASALAVKAEASALAAKADLVGGVVPLSQLPPPLVRLTYVFPAGQTSTYECPIVFLSQAGSYQVEQQNGVKAADPAPSFFINGVPSAPPYNVALGDTLSITAATPAGQKGFIILRAA